MIHIRLKNFNHLHLRALMDVCEDEVNDKYSIRTDMMKEHGEVVLDFSECLSYHLPAIKYYIKCHFLPRILA